MEIIATNEETDHNTDGPPPTKKKKKNPFNPNRKEDKEKRRQKRARIVIRNISYKATEELLREHFEKYGKILDVNLLKRPDGKLVGCAFIQYEAVNQAAKAILQGTNKDFLGRSVFVDWAVGKDEFGKKTVGESKGQKKLDESEIKEEHDSDDENSIKSEKGSESDEDDDDDKSIKSEEDDESDDEKKDVKRIKLDPDEEKPKKISNDVREGCTVFIKNIPFDATDNDLRKVCRKFGLIYYAIINRDFVSGHSKGTGFVKFKTKDSADLCLRSGEEFILMDTILEPFPAMSREEVKTQANSKSKKDENRDSRNLYLCKEGLIMTGAKSSEGVSTSDMTKRHNLERVKTQVLKNLNRFVSRNRLSIHNLPLQFDNEKLRQMIVQFTGLRPHECRVMREMKITAEYPQGKSKGFGFMSFNTHLDALAALRKLNNNPNVFTNANRPIVSFSIEDRAVHKIKEKRLEKSRANNPTYQTKLQNKKEHKKQKKNEQKSTQPDNKTVVQNQIKQLEASRNQVQKKPTSENHEDFVGESAKQGSFVRMRSMKKIRAQAQEHKQKIGEIKRKAKNKKEKREIRKEKSEVVRTKPKKLQPDSDSFSNLVDKYKSLIVPQVNASTTKSKRKKWYTE